MQAIPVNTAVDGIVGSTTLTGRVRSAAVPLAFGTILVGLLWRLMSQQPPLVKLKNIDATTVSQIMSSLLFLALFVERALEVVVSTWRDPGASELELELQHAQEYLDTLRQQNASPQDVNGAVLRVRQAKNAQGSYGTMTKRIALWSGLLLGVAVSAVGIRMLTALVADPATAPSLPFILVDIVITGAVIAGGADGIHKMAKVYSDFMETTSKRIQAGS